MALPRLLQDNLRIPLIGAPMFIVSCPELVIAQCQAGIAGSFPALNARPQARLEDWILQIKESLVAYAEENPAEIVAPFAVNQIVHASNARLQADLDACIKHEVPIIITSLRPPALSIQRRSLVFTAIIYAGASNEWESTRMRCPMLMPR